MNLSDDAKLHAAAILTAAKMTGSGMLTGPDGKSSVALTLALSLQEIDIALEVRKRAAESGEPTRISADLLKRP